MENQLSGKRAVRKEHSCNNDRETIKKKPALYRKALKNKEIFWDTEKMNN